MVHDILNTKAVKAMTYVISDVDILLASISDCLDVSQVRQGLANLVGAKAGIISAQ